MGTPMTSDGKERERIEASARAGDGGDDARPDPARRALLVGGAAAAALALCQGERPDDEERDPAEIIWIGHL